MVDVVCLLLTLCSLLLHFCREGEIPGSLDNSRPLQDIVGEYLSQLNATYDTSIQGRLVNDTNAFEPMDFVETAASCDIDHYWHDQSLSCKPCRKCFFLFLFTLLL